ncbi:MAG: FliM/FliN family flagellar motor switch protein [Acidobacteriaceae bacterium]|nr:FliM/FliN family flagellar motor switch protein [Acidobacteriaceae bacterium]
MAVRTPVHPESASPSGRIVPYDFHQPDRIPAGQLRSLRSVQQDLARGLGASLSAYLRTVVSIAPTRIDQVSFAEFSRSAPQPLTSFSLRIRPQDVRALLQVSHNALFPMLEILLGGKGSSPVSIDRDITEIERVIFTPILRILMQELKLAWAAVSALEFALEGEETSRQYLASLPPAHELLTVGFNITVGELAGSFQIGLPSRAIRAVLQAAEPSQAEPPAEDRSKLLRLIQPAQLNADVRLNGPRMLLRDLLNIESGDILTFDHPLSKEVELELNGASKFQGHIVSAGKKRAFQVKRQIVRENEAR